MHYKFEKNKTFQRILTIVISFVFLTGNFSGISFSDSLSRTTLAPATNFSDTLLTPRQIKQHVMLEYTVLAAEKNAVIDLAEYDKNITNLELGIDFDLTNSDFGEKLEIVFLCRNTDNYFIGEDTFKMVPCRIIIDGEETEHWYCKFNKAVRENGADFVFFTDEEKNAPDFFTTLSDFYEDDHTLERNEQVVIARALESEIKEDEKIRKAINNGESLRIDYSNYKNSLMFIRMFLKQFSKYLADDFNDLVHAEQLKVITSAGENALLVPHAGGKGIYLPNDRKFINPETIIYAVFTKAGYDKEESEIFVDIFESFIKSLTNDGTFFINGITNKDVNKKGRAKLLSEAEYATFRDEAIFSEMNSKIQTDKTKLAISELLNLYKQINEKKMRSQNGRKKFVDLTENIKTRDYSYRKKALLRFKALQNREISGEIAEQLLSMIEKHEHQMFWVMNMKGKIVYVNGASKKIIGYSPEEILDNEITQKGILTPESTEIVREYLKEVNSGSLQQNVMQNEVKELKYNCKDGTVKKLKVVGQVNYDEDNNPVFVGSTYDLTDLEEAKEGVVLSEQIIENLNTATYRSTLEHGFAKANAAMSKLFGYTREEFLSMRSVEMIYAEPMDREKFLSEISKAEGRMVEDWEIRMKRKDGEVITCAISGTAVFGAEGNVKWINGTIRDITEFKKIQESQKIINSLQEMEIEIVKEVQDMDNLGEMLNEIMAIVKAKAEHISCGGIYANTGEALVLEGSTGLSSGFVKTWSPIYKDDPRMEIVNEMYKKGRALFTNYDKVMEMAGIKTNPEGLEGFALIPIIHDNELVGLWNLASTEYPEIPEEYHERLKAIAGWIGGVIKRVDIEEDKKEYEEALILSELNHTTIIENMLIGLVTLDPDGKLVNANPAYLKTTGVNKAADIIGVNMFDFLEYIAPPGIMEKIIEGKGAKVEVKIDFTDPKIRGWLNNKTSRGLKEDTEDYIYVTCLVARSGIRHDRRYGYTMNFLDVTERRKLEEELKSFAATTSTTEKFITEELRAISEYAPQISHDMNNVISGIVGNIDLANLKLSKQDAQASESTIKVISAVSRYLSNIEEAVNKLTDMAASYMNMSKVKEEGARACFVESSLEAVVNFRKREIKKAGIKVNMDLSGTFPAVIAAEVLLQGVFINLIMNAESFMVKPYLEDNEKKELTIKTEIFKSEETEYLRIFVSDTGKGLNPGAEEKVFEPFFTDREGIQGTGMGLAGVREAVENMGGEVYAKNNEQKGAAFIVELPIYKPEYKVISEMTNNDLNVAMGKALEFMSLLLKKGSDTIDGIVTERDLTAEQMPVIYERISDMILYLSRMKRKRSIEEWEIVSEDIETKTEEIFVLRHQFLARVNVQENGNLLELDKSLHLICKTLVKSANDMKMMQKGFKNIEDEKEEPFRKIDFLRSLKYIKQQLSGEETVLPQLNAGIKDYNLEDSLNRNKKVFITANESLLGLAIYKIMMLGKGYDEGLFHILTPENRKAVVDVKLTKNNDAINVIFTNNSFLFTEEQLEKEVFEDGQTNYKILKWEDAKSNALATANYIISFFGGNIKLSNNKSVSKSYVSVNIPCCVRVTKPKKEKARSFLTPTVSNDVSSSLVLGERVKVIVVDDEPAVLQVTAAMLKRQGFEVYGFSSGKEILEALAGGLDANEFKLGLIDVQLKDESGIELVNKLGEKGIKFPVILMSGNPLTQKYQDMINEGSISNFLQKPIMFKDDAMPKIEKILAGDRNIGKTEKSTKIMEISQNKSILIFGEEEGRRQTAKSRLKSWGMQNAKFFEAWDKTSLENVLHEQSIIMIVDVSKKGIQDLLDQIFGNIAERPSVIEDLENIEKTNEIQDKILTSL